MYIFYCLLFVLLVDTIHGSRCGKVVCPKPKKGHPTNPCAPNNSVECVRKYFQKSGKCGKLKCCEDELKLEKSILYLPFFNMTVTTENVTVGGINSGEIDTFIVDCTKNMIVLTVTYTNITIENPYIDFILYKTGQQPMDMITDVSERYPSVSITTYFNDAKCPELSDSYHVANIPALPAFTAGACFSDSEDPEVKKIYKTLVTQANVVAQEIFSTRSTVFQTEWIQSHVCNYES